ncbi:MAG: CPBP family intramembrane glutamic endopeptidase [Myxococcales bacterium]
MLSVPPWCAVAVGLAIGCAPVMQRARVTREEPVSERENEARERVVNDDCSRRLSLLWPGVVQLCRGRSTEGGLMLGLGAAELGTGLAAGFDQGFGSAAAGVPLLAFGDLLTLSALDAVIESQRAARYRFVPQESLSEMAAAPFSPQVLSKPAVWAGIAGTLAAGILVSRIVDGPVDTTNFGRRPVLFGKELNSAVGYPLAGAIGIGLFEHVAIAEESAFRGLVQSGWARSSGEDRGWIYGSLTFGLVHASNIVFMDPSQRLTYLAVGVPFITALGSYLGLAYRWSGYSLAPSVAIHFWYDFLIEAYGFVLDPRHSPLALTWGMGF